MSRTNPSLFLSLFPDITTTPSRQRRSTYRSNNQHRPQRRWNCHGFSVTGQANMSVISITIFKNSNTRTPNMARSIAVITRVTSHTKKATTLPRELPRKQPPAEIKNAMKANTAARGWRIIAVVRLLIRSRWLLPNWVLTTLVRTRTAS